MAIAYFKAEVIGVGRKLVRLAVERHRGHLKDGSNAMTSRATEGDAPDHEEINLPEDAPAWIVDLVESNSVAEASEAIWNRVVTGGRADGQLARAITVALPVELSCMQNIALMQEFVRRHIVVMGVVADWVFYDCERNPQAHLLHTIRPVVLDGFGSKIMPVIGEDGKPVRCGPDNTVVYRTVTGGRPELAALRKAWCELVNRHLDAANLDVRRINMCSCAYGVIERDQRQRTARVRMAIFERLRAAISRGS